MSGERYGLEPVSYTWTNQHWRARFNGQVYTDWELMAMPLAELQLLRYGPFSEEYVRAKRAAKHPELQLLELRPLRAEDM